MKENKPEQMWLIPEVGESIEHYKHHEIGKKLGGEAFPVPNIVMDEQARKELLAWPIEISSRRIVINKPYAHFAELEPKVLFDFGETENIVKIELKMENKNRVNMHISLRDGTILQEHMILHENGAVEHVWLH